jgi:hypothetical protein
MNASARIIAPVSALAVLLVAAHWTVSGRAEGLTPSEKSVECVSGAPFDYFPAQFVSHGAESNDDIPTF